MNDDFEKIVITISLESSTFSASESWNLELRLDIGMENQM